MDDPLFLVMLMPYCLIVIGLLIGTIIYVAKDGGNGR